MELDKIEITVSEIKGNKTVRIERSRVMLVRTKTLVTKLDTF